MSTHADGDRDALRATREQYEERRMASMRRRQWKFSLALGLLWVVLAVNYWRDDDGDPVLPWLWTVLAVVQLVTAAVLWRRVRREMPA